MLIGDPPPTKGDLFFSLFGIPVRVHPLFWLVGLIFGLPGRGQDGGLKAVLEALVPWMAAFFLAIHLYDVRGWIAIIDSS